MPVADSLNSLAAAWADTPESHAATAEACATALTTVPELAAHRHWCAANNYGYDEGCFHWLWLLLARSLPTDFRFLEIGVHRGQSLSAVALAATLEGKTATVVGLSPFDGTGGFEVIRDYRPDIDNLFARFNGDQRPVLIQGLSTDSAAKSAAAALAPFDCCYIDGEHSLEATSHDLRFYGDLVRPGGYLLADDAGGNLQLPVGYFRGFQGSSDAADQYLPPLTANPRWRHLTNLSHLRLWQRLPTSN